MVRRRDAIGAKLNAKLPKVAMVAIIRVGDKLWLRLSFALAMDARYGTTARGL